MNKVKKFKEFVATSWAIDNKTSIYVLVIFIFVLGMLSYMGIPKELFPELVIPTVMVNTPYPGTSPEDIENLVTRPIEKELKGLADVDKVTSNSIQDFSSIVVEFTTDVEVSEAKQRVKDAVDKARTKLPSTLPDDPEVMEIDFSEIPIMYINISGNYDLETLKQYGELAQDRIESLPEITRVDIIGAPEREIQVNLDMFKIQAASVSIGDIQRAISSENLTISAGNITTHGMKRSLRVVGEFESPEEIGNIILKSSSGATVYLKDIAEIKDGFKEQESFSRLEGQNVITLSVIKKSGQNLIEATDNIKNILNDELKDKEFPSDLNIVISGETARYTRNTLEELNNTAIIGFILVTLVLMFFMGFTNAFFVGLSVPLSMFIVYMIMPGMGFTMNMMVMFAFIFALGIIVDDAIVVIENTHRIHRGEPNIVVAAKQAAGEVFLPILSGTLTTLAPFFPLLFWPGIVGELMSYIPATLIMALFASLFVAYIINPVFAVSFMKHEYDTEYQKENIKKFLVIGAILLGLGLLFHLAGWTGLGNFCIFMVLLMVLFRFVLRKLIKGFQNQFWPKIMSIYEKTLALFLVGKRPYLMFWGFVALLIITFIITGIKSPKVLFFPDNEPNNIFVYITMPVGTDQKVTDSVTREVENRIFKVLGRKNPAIESVISNVTIGAGDEESFDRASSTEKGKVSVNFVEYKFREKGVSTTKYLDQIRDAVKGIPGAEISVNKNNMGPPVGKPINIEITGENLDDLIAYSDGFKNYLDSLQIPGVEELKTDFQNNKPEITVNIDRRRANMEGISTAQIAMEIRNALFGAEVSKFKELEDEYPIQVRYTEDTRENIDALMNLKLIFMDMNSGQLRQIPLSSVASFDYTNTYGGIKRKDLKRIITLYSEVLSDYTPNEVIAEIKNAADKYGKKDGINISFTGEQEEQEESMMFLFKAMIITIGLIFFILITQFNSLSKTAIILSEVLFSIIGVLLGIVIFDMSISIIMTGLGIVALGGIVVRNGILIVEFTDVLKERGLKTRQAILQAGKVRTTPVILTATATMLGLVPLGIGMNINFITMFTELNPQLHFGGDNVMFWGPLSWTIIFGLSFATFITLVFVPVMYYIAYVMKIRIKRRKSNKLYRKQLASL